MHRHAFELQADFGKFGRKLRRQRLRKGHLVGCQVQKWNIAAGNRIADVLQHQATQLTIHIFHAVALARARNFSME